MFFALLERVAEPMSCRDGGRAVMMQCAVTGKVQEACYLHINASQNISAQHKSVLNSSNEEHLSVGSTHTEDILALFFIEVEGMKGPRNY